MRRRRFVGMLSGATGGLLGRLIAQEVLDGVAADLLEPYRPDQIAGRAAALAPGA